MWTLHSTGSVRAILHMQIAGLMQRHRHIWPSQIVGNCGVICAISRGHSSGRVVLAAATSPIGAVTSCHNRARQGPFPETAIPTWHADGLGGVWGKMANISGASCRDIDTPDPTASSSSGCVLPRVPPIHSGCRQPAGSSTPWPQVQLPLLPSSTNLDGSNLDKGRTFGGN